jgi:phosphatidylglycerol:prolipoprotein diacylglycerol transferase
VGIFFGRMANFINGELYGRAAEGVAWAMKFPLSLVEQPLEVQSAAWQECTRIEPALANVDSLDVLIATARENPQVSAALGEFLTPRHPSQIYAAFLEGLLLFAILWCVRTRLPKAPDGLLTGLFFGFYALFRIIDEQFREPDAAMVGIFTKGQFFSLFMFLFAAGFLFHAWRGWRRRSGV